MMTMKHSTCDGLWPKNQISVYAFWKLKFWCWYELFKINSRSPTNQWKHPHVVGFDTNVLFCTHKKQVYVAIMILYIIAGKNMFSPNIQTFSKWYVEFLHWAQKRNLHVFWKLKTFMNNLLYAKKIIWCWHGDFK